LFAVVYINLIYSCPEQAARSRGGLSGCTQEPLSTAIAPGRAPRERPRTVSREAVTVRVGYTLSWNGWFVPVKEQS